MMLSLCAVVILLLDAVTYSHALCAAGMLLGSCASGGAIQGDSNTCYKIVKTKTTWTNGYSACSQSALLDFGLISLSYGRLATFTNISEYYDVVTRLNAANGPVVAWIGAFAPTNGYTLDEYCWMKQPTVQGSQITTVAQAVNYSASATPDCLYIDTSDPFSFYADSVAATTTHYALCEIGCTGVQTTPTCTTTTLKTNGCAGSPYACSATMSLATTTTTLSLVSAVKTTIATTSSSASATSTLFSSTSTASTLISGSSNTPISSALTGITSTASTTVKSTPTSGIPTSIATRKSAVSASTSSTSTSIISTGTTSTAGPVTSSTMSSSISTGSTTLGTMASRTATVGVSTSTFATNRVLVTDTSTASAAGTSGISTGSTSIANALGGPMSTMTSAAVSQTTSASQSTTSSLVSNTMTNSITPSSSIIQGTVMNNIRISTGSTSSLASGTSPSTSNSVFTSSTKTTGTSNPSTFSASGTSTTDTSTTSTISNSMNSGNSVSSTVTTAKSSSASIGTPLSKSTSTSTTSSTTIADTSLRSTTSNNGYTANNTMTISKLITTAAISTIASTKSSSSPGTSTPSTNKSHSILPTTTSTNAASGNSGLITNQTTISTAAVQSIPQSTASSTITSQFSTTPQTNIFSPSVSSTSTTVSTAPTSLYGISTIRTFSNNNPSSSLAASSITTVPVISSSTSTHSSTNSMRMTSFDSMLAPVPTSTSTMSNSPMSSISTQSTRTNGNSTSTTSEGNTPLIVSSSISSSEMSAEAPTSMIELSTTMSAVTVTAGTTTQIPKTSNIIATTPASTTSITTATGQITHVSSATGSSTDVPEEAASTSSQTGVLTSATTSNAFGVPATMLTVSPPPNQRTFLSTSVSPTVFDTVASTAIGTSYPSSQDITLLTASLIPSSVTPTATTKSTTGSSTNVGQPTPFSADSPATSHHGGTTIILTNGLPVNPTSAPGILAASTQIPEHATSSVAPSVISSTMQNEPGSVSTSSWMPASGSVMTSVPLSQGQSSMSNIATTGALRTTTHHLISNYSVSAESTVVSNEPGTNYIEVATTTAGDITDSYMETTDKSPISSISATTVLSPSQSTSLLSAVDAITVLRTIDPSSTLMQSSDSQAGPEFVAPTTTVFAKSPYTTRTIDASQNMPIATMSTGVPTKVSSLLPSITPTTQNSRTSPSFKNSVMSKTVPEASKPISALNEQTTQQMDLTALLTPAPTSVGSGLSDTVSAESAAAPRIIHSHLETQTSMPTPNSADTLSISSRTILPNQATLSTTDDRITYTTTATQNIVPSATGMETSEANVFLNMIPTENNAFTVTDITNRVQITAETTLQHMAAPGTLTTPDSTVTKARITNQESLSSTRNSHYSQDMSVAAEYGQTNKAITVAVPENHIGLAANIGGVGTTFSPIGWSSSAIESVYSTSTKIPTPTEPSAGSTGSRSIGTGSNNLLGLSNRDTDDSRQRGFQESITEASRSISQTVSANMLSNEKTIASIPARIPSTAKEDTPTQQSLLQAKDGKTTNGIIHGLATMGSPVHQSIVISNSEQSTQPSNISTFRSADNKTAMSSLVTMESNHGMQGIAASATPDVLLPTLVPPNKASSKLAPIGLGSMRNQEVTQQQTLQPTFTSDLLFDTSAGSTRSASTLTHIPNHNDEHVTSITRNAAALTTADNVTINSPSSGTSYTHATAAFTAVSPQKEVTRASALSKDTSDQQNVMTTSADRAIADAAVKTAAYNMVGPASLSGQSAMRDIQHGGNAAIPDGIDHNPHTDPAVSPDAPSPRNVQNTSKTTGPLITKLSAAKLESVSPVATVLPEDGETEFMATMPGDLSDQCQYDEWSPFGHCSATCGNSVKSRQRIRSPGLNSTADCSAVVETVPCDGLPRCNPMSLAELTAAEVMMKIGCSWILLALACSLFTFLLFRNYDYLRIIQANEDFSLFVAHLLLFLFAVRNDRKFSHDHCKIASLGLLYFFLVTFLSQTFEALYIHNVLTDVAIGQQKQLVSLKWAMAIAWGAPFAVTAVTAVTSFSTLISDYSCWINMGGLPLLAFYVPAGTVGTITLVLLEAAGMGSTQRKSPLITSCRVAHGGLTMTFSFQAVAWVLSSAAIYYQQIWLFAIVLKLNVACGVFIYSAHVFSNEKLRKMVKNLYDRIRGRKTEIKPKI